MDAMTIQMKKYKIWFSELSTRIKKFFRRADLEMQCKFCSREADRLRSYSEIELERGQIVKYREYAICMKCIVKNKSTELI